MSEVVEIVESALLDQAFGKALVPPKVDLTPDAKGFFHAMPASVGHVGSVGVKWVSYFPGNRTRRIESSSATLVLSSADSGHPYCIMDALRLTDVRTAACAILTIRKLARIDSGVLCLVGAGRLARSILPLMLDQLSSIRRVNIVTRSVQSATQFKSDVAPQVDRELCVFDSVTEAAANADILITSIGHPAEPPLTRQDLHDGILALPLDAEGAWTPESFRQADQLFADDVCAFLAGWEKRRPDEEPPDVTANLASVIKGDHGRRTPDERLIAANNGIASLDVSVGAHIFDRARADGAGLRLR